MNLLLDLEGIFFAAGKAPIVLGVAIIILIGIGVWMIRMDKKLSNLEAQIDNHNCKK